MRNRHLRFSRLRLAAALGTMLALMITGLAFAAKPTKNATYDGSYTGRSTETLSFKVSANGKRISDIYVETPFRCSGGCGGAPSGENGSAKVTEKGTFKSTMKLLGPGSTKAEGKDTIVGTFERGGKAKGTVTSKFYGSSIGETVHWTATATAT